MAAMSEARIKEIFRERRHRANLDTLSARGKASPFHRRRLPDSGDIFSGLHFDQCKFLYIIYLICCYFRCSEKLKFDV